MKITPIEVERRIDQATQSRQTSCPEQSFAEMTLEQFKQALQAAPKYGENSAVYFAMGYVPKSERSSGLTRRRETETQKESTEAS